MREAELLNALAAQDPGIQLDVYRFQGQPRACVTTLYRPRITTTAATIMLAATGAAGTLLEHPDCPPAVKEALEAYDQHTAYLET